MSPLIESLKRCWLLEQCRIRFLAIIQRYTHVADGKVEIREPERLVQKPAIPVKVSRIQASQLYKLPSLKTLFSKKPEFYKVEPKVVVSDSIMEVKLSKPLFEIDSKVSPLKALQSYSEKTNKWIAQVEHLLKGLDRLPILVHLKSLDRLVVVGATSALVDVINRSGLSGIQATLCEQSEPSCNPSETELHSAFYSVTEGEKSAPFSSISSLSSIFPQLRDEELEAFCNISDVSL